MARTEVLTHVETPYGGVKVEDRKAAMKAGLSDEEIAKRNVIPTTAPNGQPLRILADEYFSDIDSVNHYKPAAPNDPGPASKQPVKPGVLKLAAKVTDRIGVKETPAEPDYWGLASVVTEEEAALLEHMKVRVPQTFAQIQTASGIDAKTLGKLLDALSLKGVLEYNWENLDGKNAAHEKRYVLPMFVPGSAEFTVMNQRQLEEHPELGTFFERMSYLPLTKVTKMVPEGGAGIGMHVIPVEHAISFENKSESVEHISHWLRRYDHFAAGACSCRLAERTRGEGCADDPQGWCIGVGDMADFLVETGRGHYITFDQVLDTLVLAEKNGFVHQITNIDGVEKIFAICNCNVNVCFALRTSQLFNTPNLSRSAYVAHVDAEKCTACAGCVNVCPAGAVKLGQKLPTVEGPVVYPKQALPTLGWGEDDWDPDYKNTARVECHASGSSPCKAACPAHVSVQAYLRAASLGKYRQALATIKKSNPFPAVCGRVCNRRCEAACTRGTIDEAVAIDEVKRFVADQDLVAENRYVPERIPASTRGGFDEKIAIVGAGPAGLTAAFFLAQMGYEPVVFEKNERPGGMLTYGIPSYKLAKDVVAAEIDIMREMGVEIRCSVEVGKDVSLAELREQGFRAFYIAIGCQGGRAAGIEGEDAAGVMSAVDFLHAVADDPALALSGNVVVVGGGNVAIDAARCALRCGAADVKMVCLEQRDEMPALPEEIAEAEAEGVKVVNGWGPARIESAGGDVNGITFKRCTSVFNEEHRFSPVYDESDTCDFVATTVIMAIGQSIEWGNMLEGEGVKLGRGNGAVADPVTYQTDQADVFVGGDVYTGPRFVIDAIAAGKEAAVSLHRFVQKGSSLTTGRAKLAYTELDKEKVAINPMSYDHASRQVSSCEEGCAATSVLRNWEEDRRAFTPEQVKIETARCLSCGASIVDANRCIGCGLCTTRCGFDAIHLHRDNPKCSTMVPSEKKLARILPNAAKMLIKRKA